ncbi:hypothetical protein [Streptomyces sp. NPDC057617]|uniref:hypothetical protein n=1 Tax=Streptomyces sp. NPDC057617 TaxID=3346184 RepID=UPI003687C3D9
MTTTAEQHLTSIITTWPHLQDLLTTRQTEPWPPADPAEYARQLDEHDATEVGQLVLRKTGAPLRLHILDTMRTVELVLTQLADETASAIQRDTIKPVRGASGDPAALSLALLAARDDADPARWRYNHGDRSAVQAARWLLARVRGDAGPCRPLSDAQRERIGVLAAEAARRIARAAGSDRRHDPLPRPCPWSAGILTLHHGGTEPEQVTCEHGHDCAAPVPVIDGRRTWTGPELVELEKALTAADRRASRAAARRRQRATKNAAA